MKRIGVGAYIIDVWVPHFRWANGDLFILLHWGLVQCGLGALRAIGNRPYGGMVDFRFGNICWGLYFCLRRPVW